MLTRTLAAAALVALSVGAAHAGSMTNGVWNPSGCGTDPGAAPEISTKNPNAYNASVKEAQAWQEKTKTYTECLVAEGKTDQGAIVSTMNAHITAFNTSSQAIATESNEALKKLNGKKPLGAQSPHND